MYLYSHNTHIVQPVNNQTSTYLYDPATRVSYGYTQMVIRIWFKYSHGPEQVCNKTESKTTTAYTMMHAEDKMMNKSSWI